MFNIEFENSEKLIVYPKGELDVYTSPEFKESVINKYRKDKKNILIDAEELEYIDSTGLGALIFILNEISEDENKITLINVKSSIKKLFTITKLDSVFEMRD
ncbi:MULTISPECIES: STAS domain-containing protein [Peptoniphilus]|uniref:STAS domain-containing protein n=1 Tax=Peptoniphilus TaxID=162289 RepID=UPI0002E084B4|nr:MULTISPECIES: STAS domain-containing protein [Peptoniphilus]